MLFYIFFNFHLILGFGVYFLKSAKQDGWREESTIKNKIFKMVENSSN